MLILNLKDFFEKLYPGFNQNSNTIDVMYFSIENNKPDYKKRRFFNQLSDLTSYVQKNEDNTKHQIYFRCPELKPGSYKGKKEDCARFPFLYADLDMYEKNKDGVKIKVSEKTHLLNKLETFEIQPTIIVDSGNGYHAYWLMDTPITEVNKAEIYLKALQLKLGADIHAKLTTQLLRVPFTYNLKNYLQDQVKTKVEIVKFGDESYSQEYLYEKLDIKNINKPGTKKETKVNKLEAKNSPIMKINHSMFSFKNKPIPLNEKPESFQELLRLIKSQDIFLATESQKGRLGETFTCCLHQDNSPSANIYKGEDGFYYYKCFGCGSHYDIIGFYQKLFKKNFTETVLFLCDFFGIQFEYQTWVVKQWEKYYKNAMLLDDFERLGYAELYPNLYKLIKPRIRYLSLINQYGLAKISSEKYAYKDHNLFFFSYQYFASKYRVGLTTIKRNVSLFATLGLIEKVALNKIDPYVAKKAISEVSKIPDIDKRNPVNFYIAPVLFDVLEEAEKRAEVLINTKFTMKNCTNKTFLLRNLGEEIANEVYDDKRSISKTSENIAKQLEQTLLKLIKENGYATKKQVISKTKMAGRLKIYNDAKEKELERHLGQMLNRNQLEYRKANKEQLEKYKLKAYVNIIVPID